MSITLQKQPSLNTCASACLAMLTGQPVDEVVQEFHDNYFNHTLEINDYLASKGVIVERGSSRTSMKPDSVYILIVPSLNSAAQFHMVLYDSRYEDIEVIDPSRKQRYIAQFKDAEPGETNILTWIIDWEVVHAPAIEIYQGIH